jgi:hypothetical protein
MADISVENIAQEMYQLLAEAAGKRNLNANDLVKLMAAKFGAACTKDECKKAIRQLIESGKCVYCFLGGVNYIQVAPKQDAAAGR